MVLCAKQEQVLGDQTAPDMPLQEDADNLHVRSQVPVVSAAAKYQESLYIKMSLSYETVHERSHIM